MCSRAEKASRIHFKPALLSLCGENGVAHCELAPSGVTADESVMHINETAHVDETSLPSGAIARGNRTIIYPAQGRPGTQ